MVPLRSYARWKRNRSDGNIYEFVWEEQLGLAKSLTETFVDFMVDVETRSHLKGLCRVMLDGWDEVPPDLRPGLEQDMERFRWFIPVLALRDLLGLARVTFLRSDLKSYRCRSNRCGVDARVVSQIGRMDLEKELCGHLDRHIGLR